jgi:hypothetical protein
VELFSCKAERIALKTRIRMTKAAVFGEISIDLMHPARKNRLHCHKTAKTVALRARPRLGSATFDFGR